MSVPVIERCVGLDNTIDSLLPIGDLDLLVTRLASTANIKITKSLKIEQGPGNGVLFASSTGGFHSVWRDSGDCYAINEGASSAGLVRVVGIDPVSFVVVRGGLTKNRPMEFIDIGGGRVLYSNGVENGYIAATGLSSAWPTDTYFGPPTDTVFSAAPVADHMAYRNGVALLAVGSTIYCNFVPFVFGLFALAEYNTRFKDDIVMMKAVSDGFFASCTKYTWFLRGDNCTNFHVGDPVAMYPANEWGVSTKYAPGSMFGLGKDSRCAVWTSPKGICVGFPDGTMRLYDKRVTLKNEAVSGDAACMVFDEDYIIATYQ